MLPIPIKIPLSDQIAIMLARDIHTGVLCDGDKLPPERRMASTLGISVGTLRKALAELERKNLLERVQGSGNFVRYSPDLDTAYALFRLERLDGPATPNANLLGLETLNKSSELPFTSPQQHVFRITRIRQLDNIDAALEEIFLDGRFADSLQTEAVHEALYRFYQEALGLRITRIEDRVSVAPLPDWAPTSLKTRDIAEWGYIDRYARDQDGMIAEFSRTWFDPTQVRFVARY